MLNELESSRRIKQIEKELRNVEYVLICLEKIKEKIVYISLDNFDKNLFFNLKTQLYNKRDLLKKEIEDSIINKRD